MEKPTSRAGGGRFPAVRPYGWNGRSGTHRKKGLGGHAGAQTVRAWRGRVAGESAADERAANCTSSAQPGAPDCRLRKHVPEREVVGCRPARTIRLHQLARLVGRVESSRPDG